MFARSIYVSDYTDDYILDDKCELYFTSFHVPEELNDSFAEKAKALLKRLEKENKRIIVDLSPRGLKALGYERIPDFVRDYDIDYIRFDYGFSQEDILETKMHCGVVVNASTVNRNYFGNSTYGVLAIHNFYPRKETGLDYEYFETQNRLFKKNGIDTGAYISSDKDLRGPLFEGLTTLEENRYLPPYVQYCLIKDKVDLVILGDGGISDVQRDLIHLNEADNVISLPVDFDSKYEYLYEKVFSIRIDSPETLLRVKESREYATQGEIIKPENCIERKIGSVTIDNEKYLRYSGEIQICKKDYPQDDKVNVLGVIKQDYLPLLRCINRHTKFRFIKI